MLKNHPGYPLMLFRSPKHCQSKVCNFHDFLVNCKNTHFSILFFFFFFFFFFFHWARGKSKAYLSLKTNELSLKCPCPGLWLIKNQHKEDMAQNIFRNAIARKAIKVLKFQSSQIHANESFGTKNHQYYIFHKMLTNGSAY